MNQTHLVEVRSKRPSSAVATERWSSSTEDGEPTASNGVGGVGE